jgi:3-dehydroquinate dehydratase/shikimate dehydrogenase
VTVAAPGLAAMEAQAAEIGGAQTGYEWRLDYLRDSAGLDEKLREMLFRLRFPCSVATCRRAEAGGQFTGSVEEQAQILEAAVRGGCHWVDIEIESVDRVGRALLGRFKAANVLVSYHDYQAMPRLGEVYRRLSRLPVQAIKIAGHVRRLTDNLTIEKFLKIHQQSRVVVVGMGPSGMPSRLLGLKWGSLFAYASTGSQASVASGQIPAQLMRGAYRVEHVDARTHLYGIVGSQASVSLSPAMQNMALNAKHVNAIYLPCETQSLSDFLKFARELNFSGFSVTMPYKQAMIRELDWMEPLAAKIGACNTVAIQRGRWMGWNTDAAAVVEVLTKRLRLAGSRILILGAGGAARAAAFALRGEGAEVVIAARREIAAQELARAAAAQVVSWSSADGLDVDTVINATPIGMAPKTEAVPIDLARLRVRVVFDMVYRPVETRFLTEARGRGLITISGLEMLVDQGARQFEIWTGQPAPRALMEQAVRQGFRYSDFD